MSMRKSIPRVLLTTDEFSYTLGLIKGYTELGWDVVVGANNFRIRAAQYDLIHHQWPEEFSNWVLPSQRNIEEIKGHLEWWKERTINIFSVNNLYPHQHDRAPAFHSLYSLFYQNCQLITHFSQASLDLVLQEFPVARTARHLVHSPGGYSVALERQTNRGSRRHQMGIRADEFVILVIGTLRSWKEIKLIRDAYDLARIPNSRLLIAGKSSFRGFAFKRRLKLLWLKWWLIRRKAFVDTRYVPEEEISQFVDSCDVAIVPRLSGLSSAIPLLAMTFGKMVIAPDHGAYPEYLQGTRNLIYKTGDAKSLARKLEEAVSLDREAIGRENEVIASTWSWKRICQTCFEAVGAGLAGLGS